MHTISERLAAGGTLLLDGATGTELERRGAPMSEAAWCALATEAAPEVLRGVHEDYLRAGADIITANTYASSLIMLGAGGMEEKFEPLNRQAVAVAREARERVAGERPVAVAGSISNMMPMVPGAARVDTARLLPLDEAEAAFRAQADVLADAGVDLLLLEMHYRPEYLDRSIRAALATGLPVWVGSSVRWSEGAGPRRVLGFMQEQDLPFDEIVDVLVGAGPVQVLGVMHSNVSVTGPALEVLRKRWTGPLMAYPDSGHFEMPHWAFVDVVEPAALAREASAWLDAGVQVLGGCCGLGVEHVKALRALLDEHPAGG